MHSVCFLIPSLQRSLPVLASRMYTFALRIQAIERRRKAMRSELMRVGISQMSALSIKWCAEHGIAHREIIKAWHRLLGLCTRQR